MNHSFEYDVNGNRSVKRQGRTGPVLQSYVYDQKNRVTSLATATAGGTLTFQYDANDFRIGKVSNKGARSYLLEGDHFEAVYGANDTLRAKYLRGVVVDEIVNGYLYDDNGASTNYTFHHDHLQSVTALSGHNGAIEETAAFGPFGETISRSGRRDNNLQYTGRETDPETGLYYYRARYYDPEIGRFLNEDPKGFGAGVNFYTYVLNNPINFSDPMGLKNWVTIGDGAVSAVAGLAGIASGAAGSATGVGAVLGVPTVIAGAGSLSWGVSKIALGWFQEDMVSYTIPSPSFTSVTTLLVTGDVHQAFVNDAIVETLMIGTSSCVNALDMSVPLIEDGLNFVTFLNPAVNGRSLFDPVASSASGGFVLYPNKRNNNSMQQVYIK